MRIPKVVLDNLTSKAENKGYKFKRLYRNLYNLEFYLMAYNNIYAKEGNMTPGVDKKTIDDFNLEKVDKVIETIKNQSYQPYPARREYIPKKNSNKMRPLGIPAFYDKLVQEVVRNILEAIYENQFLNTSHGFRPNRSCHTALNSIRNSYNGTRWFVEGDIKSFFDNIDHHILIGLLKKKIDDEKFLNLIWKFLKAGYLEKWTFHKTYSGTPQGGIISPILANIYLHELDEYMMEYETEFQKGKRRKVNPEYKKYSSQVEKIENWLKKNEYPIGIGKNAKWLSIDETKRKELTDTLKNLRKIMLKLPYTDPMDDGYKRIKYVRYADDFLIGVIGSKEEAKQIKADIKNFLNEKLKIELSVEKTLITNSKQKIRFLGYDITIDRSEDIKRDKNGRLKRNYNGRPKLYVPFEIWRDKLISLRAIKFENKNNKEIWKPMHRTLIKDCDDLEIILQYNAEIRGIYNFYRLAVNVSVLNKFKYFMEYSMYKTYANKYKTTISKIIKNHKINGKFGIKYKTKDNPNKICYFYDKGFKRNIIVKTNEKIDQTPNTIMHRGRTNLIDRLLANECEWCGKTGIKIHMHHVRKLKDLKGKKKWEQIMISRKRKTMALCEKCHYDLHAGKLD